MTRQQIEYLLSAHKAQRDFAKAYLDKHYLDLEEQGKEREWVDRWVYHKRVVEQLEREIPDNQ